MADPDAFRFCDDRYSVNSNGTYSDLTARYAIGGGIGFDIGPYPGADRPTFRGSGVFLDPQGAVNSGSWGAVHGGQGNPRKVGGDAGDRHIALYVN